LAIFEWLMNELHMSCELDSCEHFFGILSHL
jgi:hypothetical protein